MSSAARIAIAAAALIAVADGVVVSQRSTADYPSACVLPLTDYCKRDKEKCLTYEAQRANWETWLAGGQLRVEPATCGEWRTLRFDSGLGSETLYYDRGGRLIGVATWSDAIDPVCNGERAYGWVPACVRKPGPAPVRP